jgi:hypothetical protein
VTRQRTILNDSLDLLMRVWVEVSKVSARSIAMALSRIAELF